MSLVKDLLTENRYWAFWSGDWTVCIYIYWTGQTKWSEVVQAVKNEMITRNVRLQAVHEIGYERQVQLREPDMSFE